jgi:hypothetical protein
MDMWGSPFFSAGSKRYIDTFCRTTVWFLFFNDIRQHIFLGHRLEQRERERERTVNNQSFQTTHSPQI